MQGLQSWLGASLEGLQCSTPAVGLSAEDYGVHEAGKDKRHPRLCNVSTQLRSLVREKGASNARLPVSGLHGPIRVESAQLGDLNSL